MKLSDSDCLFLRLDWQGLWCSVLGDVLEGQRRHEAVPWRRIFHSYEYSGQKSVA